MFQRPVKTVAGDMANITSIGVLGIELHNQIALAVNHVTVSTINGLAVKQGHNNILVMVDVEVVVGEM